VPPKRTVGRAVFLNIPYDNHFHHLCLAYICGIASFGLVPRATLEIPGIRRLDRIVELIESCAFSIHDLSRIERLPPQRLPRFNMPFELGLAVTWQKLRPRQHLWYVFEAERYRTDRTLSDIAGTDVYIHRGTIDGVLRQVSNAFVREHRQPTFDQMMRVYRMTRRALPAILRASGSHSIFDGARPFRDVCLCAADVASTLIVEP
jgi:hypothetical protein